MRPERTEKPETTDNAERMPWRQATPEQDGDHAAACECWIWTGATNDAGHPTKRDGDTTTTAARYIYEQLYGPIEAGFVLASLCSTQLCVRPNHREPIERGRFNTERDGRLTPAIAKRALLLGKQGFPVREIAHRLNIGTTTAHRILRGKHWTQTEGDSGE